MALETVVFQTDPFSYNCKDLNEYWESYPPSLESENISSSPEGSATDSVLLSEGISSRRRKRRIGRSKNIEEIQNQRMIHIAVERNRRKQMNEYLAILRSLMPPCYAQRGDQASIVGGAINYVKELEQLVHIHESRNQIKKSSNPNCSSVFANFFTFPQFSTCMNPNCDVVGPITNRSSIADVEVAMVERHANIKVLSRKQPKQLLKMVNGFHSLCLTILHLNATTVGDMVLYSLNVKVEDDCQLATVNEIATAVHTLIGMIQEEAMSA